MKVQFATSSYRSSSLPVSAQRLVNMYAERQSPDAKTLVAVFGCPGIVLLGTCGAGPVRGMHVMGGVLYVVSGGTLYSMTNTGTATALGGTVTGSGPVRIDDNGTQLAITNGTNGYIYSVSGGFQLISDADFHAPNTVTFFDQRFVFDRAGTNQFFCSDSLDGTSYQALAIASAESRPDNVVAVVLNGQVLHVFGDKTIELWQDVGAVNFPFERVPGAVIERGLAAPYATAKADNTIFFLGNNRVFYRLNGVTPVPVSNDAIEATWQGYASVTDAFAFAYHFAGHEFVVLSFPSVPATWVFDITSGLPHERESWDLNRNSYGRWRGNCHVSAYNKELIGDAYSGAVGYLDQTTYTEFDNIIQGIAIAPPIHSDRKRVFHSRFELDVESGVGTASGQGSDPQIMLDYSDDGGRTFVDRQRWQSMGARGAYRTRLRWNRLGQSRDRIYRVTVSDPVRRTIIAAHADATAGV